MTDKLRLDGWEYRQYQRFTPATTSKKWAQNLDPKCIWHHVAGMFGSPNVLYNFAVKETTKPVMLWLADPFTTSLEYDYELKRDGTPNRFDATRKFDENGKPIVVRKGYEVKLQTLPLNSISYGCRSSMGVSNFCGPLVLQVEDMGFSRDAGNLTEDELHFRGLAQRDMALAIMRYMDADWIPQPFINVGLPYPRSAGQKNGQRIKRSTLKKTNLGGANVLQHSVMPFPNDHGDAGAMNLGVICEIARHELNQKLPGEGAAGTPSMHTQADLITAKPAAPSPAATVPVGHIKVDTSAGKYTVPVEQTTVRPQQRGQAQHHIENAMRDLNIAQKLLTPKKKEKKK